MKLFTKAESPGFLSNQIKNLKASPVGGAHEFDLVPTGNGGSMRVGFTKPLPEIQPPSKKNGKSAEYADEKLLYKERVMLVRRDALVAALANASEDRDAIHQCAKRMLELKPNLQTLNWKMEPNVLGLSPIDAKEANYTYREVANRALAGIRLEMGVNGSTKSALPKNELVLLQLLEKGIGDSMAKLSMAAPPTGQLPRSGDEELPPPPGGYVKKTPPTPLPANAQQAPLSPRPATASPTWLSSRPVTAQAQPTWFPPPQAAAQAQPTGLPPPPGNHYLPMGGTDSPQISSQPQPQQMPVSSQPQLVERPKSPTQTNTPTNPTTSTTTTSTTSPKAPTTTTASTTPLHPVFKPGHRIFRSGYSEEDE